MSSNYSGRTTPHSNVDHPHRITYSPFNEEEDPQPVPMLPPRPPTPGPIALENRGTQTSPRPCPIHQQHMAIMTIHTPPFARQIQQPPTLQEALELRELLRNPDLQIPITTHCELHSLMFTLHRTYRNLIADENHHPNEKQRKTLEANIIESLHQIDALPFLRDLKAIPEKHPSNKNHPHHHPSLFESHTKEDSKPRNPSPPSHRPPHHRHPMEESKRTKERGRKRIILPANKERWRETSTELSTTSKENGTEEWRSSPKTKTSPTNTTMKPSEISTKSHMDFRSSWKFRTIDGG